LFYLRSPALGWLSKYCEYTVAKQNGGGAKWVELFITLTEVLSGSTVPDQPKAKKRIISKSRIGTNCANPTV